VTAGRPADAPGFELDEVARLLRVSAGAAVGDVERALRARGLGLGALAAPLSSDARATLGEVLLRSAPAIRSPKYGRALDACIGLEARLQDGTRVVWTDSPRKAVGPDWRPLVLGGRATTATLVALTLRVHAVPEASRTVSATFAHRAAALAMAREAARADVRPATWWCTGRRLCAVLEGPSALVACEQETLARLTRAAGGRTADATPCPGGAARFVPWSVLLRTNAAASQMTLDGGCLHDRGPARATLPDRVGRALGAEGIGR
jgi:glycolate oxidase FAD binding subunit